MYFRNYNIFFKTNVKSFFTSAIYIIFVYISYDVI